MASGQNSCSSRHVRQVQMSHVRHDRGRLLHARHVRGMRRGRFRLASIRCQVQDVRPSVLQGRQLEGVSQMRAFLCTPQASSSASFHRQIVSIIELELETRAKDVLRNGHVFDRQASNGDSCAAAPAPAVIYASVKFAWLWHGLGGACEDRPFRGPDRADHMGLADRDGHTRNHLVPDQGRLLGNLPAVQDPRLDVWVNAKGNMR